ncbi:hypothetical protein E3O42_13945 [Cryobacterium adonitolivorans]|uniref:Uncharacterized protein n=1 Tax=Cryobacterium adonitolivorans TaxID=1259189 RepID=A0A4R8W2Z7_9MICO|nr:hypothetical protein [Cryobacterium adonitolivorans]TFB99340.1 hypothetical protein E3O42_13945 [Cryobacterium adonitolivorans]
MPVWSWILIWTLLVAGLIAMLVWFAVHLFRKLMATMGALEDLGDQLAELDLDTGVPGAPFHPAVFQKRRVLAAAIDQARLERAHRRAHRRDLAINRGKLIQHTPYKPEDWPSC